MLLPHTASCRWRRKRFFRGQLAQEGRIGWYRNGKETNPCTALRQPRRRRSLIELLENVIAAQFEEEAAEIVGTD